MKIDLYSVVYNEEFLIPYFLRHYENIADRIFIWEDDSTDKTRELLASHPKVIFLPMEQHGADDAYWVTHLFPQYEQYSRGIADWVMIADADEFIYHPRILEVLEEEKRNGVKLLRCQGYDMVSEELPTTTGQIYEEIMLGLPNGIENKWSVFSPEIEIRFKKGRHGMPLQEIRAKRRFDTGLRILHYRYLGENYYRDHDVKIHDRHELVHHTGTKYSERLRYRLPDKSRGVPLDWFAENKVNAVNVVDSESLI